MDAKKAGLNRANSLVSAAAANNRLDRIAATKGGALSAAAVFSMSKHKKKKKKKKGGDSGEAAQDGAAAEASKSPPSAGGDGAAQTAVVPVAEPEDAGMLEPDSIEYTTRRRRIKLDLEAAEKKLTLVKAELRKRERIAQGTAVRAPLSRDL